MMNQTKKHTTSKKLLALLLALIMTVSLLPMSVFAAAVDVPETEPQVTEPVEEDVQEPEVTDAQAAGDEVAVQASTEINYVEKKQSVPLKDGTFYRIFHLDCGRKYFTVDQVKGIIDQLEANNYTHIELAFGNDGLRFLMEDMSLNVNGQEYTSDAVKTAIENGNTAKHNGQTYLGKSVGTWSQDNMDSIIDYAKQHNISVIPMMDVPGHMNAVISAMSELGVTSNGVFYTCSNKGQAFDPTDANAVAFVQALMQKYITYFAGKGCAMFNLAGDECGFSQMTNAQYTAFAKLVNSVAAMVQNAGMTALAFNDGVNYVGKTLQDGVTFDTDIAICYWTAGDNYATSTALAKSYKLINTYGHWYYVAGNDGSSWGGYQYALSHMKSNPCNKCDGGATTDYGCMLAYWCDDPGATYNETNVKNYIETLAANNSDYFTKVETPEEVTIEMEPASVKVGDTVTLRLSDNSAAAWTSSNEKVLKLNVATQAADNSVTATAIAEGDATVTTTVGDNKYTQDITVQAADTIKVTEERTINLTIGQTATDVIKDKNYAGSYTTEKPEIATVVSAKYEKVDGEKKFTAATSVSSGSAYYIKSGNTYLKLSNGTVTWVSDINSATKLTATSSSNGFKLRNASATGNNYLRYRYDEWQGNSNNSTATPLYFNESDQILYRSVTIEWERVNGQWQEVITGYANPLGTPGDETTTDPVDQTTITFKGVSEGTTYVTIGHVHYTIIVTKENLDGVSPLPIQLWITNNTIEADGTDATKTTDTGWGGDSSLGTANYVSVSAGKAYGEQGITVVEAIGLTEPLVRYEYGGTRFIAEQSGKIAQKLVFWTGRIHNSSASNIQTVWGTDYSNAGDAFNYVRYYGGKWQVSADRVNWTTVTGAGSMGGMSGCTQQLAAYYMTRTEITKEVTTDVADWGKPKDNENNSEYDKQVAGDFVLLDYAVKYVDGNRVPDTFPALNKTLAYHCETNNNAVGTDSSGNKYRMLNNFRGIETENFEVYMITVTMTSGSADTTLTANTAKNGYTYDDTTEQIVWAIDEDARAQSGLDDYTSISGSSTYSGCKVGGAMDIRGVEIYNKHGALITYYVRAKAAVEDKLIVNYYVQGETTPFYSYEIAVKADTTFDPGFARVTDPELGLVNNTVENIIKQTETVNWKLQEMPQIKAQYRYSEYDFVDADIESDCKTVNLYYTFKAEKTFVVDFGLPLVITPKDINQNLAANGVKITGADIGNVSSYAKITTDDDFNITYTLTKTIDGSDTFSLKYTGTLVKDVTTGAVQAGETAKYSITIIPASTVYYEDSFAQFHDGVGAAADAKWSPDGTEQTANQLLEVLGDKKNLYGYDEAYKNCTEFSMGSAHKVTVTADMAKNWANAADSAWPTATFTFKGTGFDIISLTDNDSGVITCEVKNAKGEKVYSTFINNYYGYKYENGSFVAAANGSDNKLYQLPIIKVSGLKYDTYTVTLTAAYGEYFDKTGDGQYSFWLDAIRVYDPMGKDYEGYNKDNEQEGYPQYIELRNALADTDNYKAVLIEGKEEAEQIEYKNFGPNHEVYLAKDQTLAFKLDGDWSRIATVQLGLKAVDGAAIYTIGSSEAKTVNTATDMYYDITEMAKDGATILIRNTGNTILSLTNVKVTFTKEATASLAIMSDTAINEAVQMVRAMYAPEEVQTFTPERFEASWNRSTVKVGQKATLTVKTSEDVEAITVDGVTIDTYRTRTQRTGWGWNAKKVTYREFTYTITASETADHAVTAVNAEGTASEAIHAVLTVRASAQRPGASGWLNKLFSSWF